MGRECRRLAAQEHECVQWPVRVEVSVQGFHVSVQGWGWGTRNQRPHLKEGEQIGLPIGPVSAPGWCARAEARSTCSPSSHSCPTLSGMVAMPAPWPPAWWHPNIDGHHRFTRGILRGRGKGRSQETRGKPELKGESKTKGVKAKRVELELNGSMRIGQRSTEQEKEGSPQRGGVQAPWEGQDQVGKESQGLWEGQAYLFPTHPGGSTPNHSSRNLNVLPSPPSIVLPWPSPVQLEGWSPFGLGHPRPKPGSPSGLLVVRGGGWRIPEGPQHSDPGWGQVCQRLLALLLPQGTLLS